MKAVVLTETNKLVVEERPMPTREADEVILRVRAAGICGSDVPRVFVYSFRNGSLDSRFPDQALEADSSRKRQSRKGINAIHGFCRQYA